MGQTDDFRSLQQALSILAAANVIPRSADALHQQKEKVLAELQRTIVDEIPAFSASGNPDVMPEAASHATDHVNEIHRLFGGGIVGKFEFVKFHSQRRAEQKFPLEYTLHAYRCGQRVLSRWMRKAATTVVKENVQHAVSAVADFAIEYTNTISTISASEYVAQTRLLAEAEGDRRTELLNTLLQGFDESDGRVARLLRRAGYLEQRQSYCVVVAQSVDPTEMDNPARVQRMIHSIGDTVSPLAIRALLGTHENIVTAVFSKTRRMSGWTALQTTLAEEIRPKLLKLGPAILIGMSTDQPSTSFVPKALDEAKLALDFASVSNRVVQYSEVPLRQLVLRSAKDDLHLAMPAWVDDFDAANKKSRGSLAATLRAYADADMNVLQAAKALSVHPNTIYSRVQRIADVTGLNAFSFHALSELLLAIDCRND